MSTRNTYRPRRRVQRSPSRKPSCAYCKEDGHWMKHRSGEAICPKLRAKATRQQEINHSLAEYRRQAIAAGEWVASQGRSAPRQPRKRTNARPAVNRFEIQLGLQEPLRQSRAKGQSSLHRLLFKRDPMNSLPKFVFNSRRAIRSSPRRRKSLMDPGPPRETSPISKKKSQTSKVNSQYS